MARKCPRCGKYFDGDGAIRYGTLFRSGVTYCSERCRDEAEASEAAKKEAKAAKKAAKQAAREEEEYESDGGSSSSSSGSGGMGVVGNVIGGVVLVLLLIIVIGVIFSKSEDANDPAVKMAKWEEHLEKRRAAFAEGLSEEGVEARGLKNFTWEEWQNRSKAKAAEKPAEKVEDISEKYRAHMNKRMSLLNGGLTDKVLHEMGYDDYTLEAFKQNYKNIKYKTLEEIRQGTAAPTRPVAAPEKAAAPVDAVAKAKAKKDATKVAAVDAVGEQQNGIDRPKASKDSKGIAIVVEGKGKTKDTALRFAIHKAVFRAVSRWVDSKERMEEKRDEVKAQMMTITQDDVRKFEVLDTQQEDGSIVLKVKVHVSKKQIAPKFAKVFPDVFGND